MWGNATATLAVVVNGQAIALTRADPAPGLQVIYRGTVNPEGTEMSGTVEWTDARGMRTGTWTATRIEP